MLCHTFIHLPGIGVRTEHSLWEKGVCSWDAFCGEGEYKTPFRGKRREFFVKRIGECRERLAACDPGFFAGSLESRELWRLFGAFRHCCAYLDIETTGLGEPGDHITTVAVYDGSEVFHFVHGDNLEQLPEHLERYKVLITYNGSCFDLPFINSYFGIRLSHVHIDLRFLLASLGYRGGLKGCEKQLGLDRAELDGVDGYFAVLLWQEYLATRNPKALETLLAYNIADTVNLENLMVQAYNLKLEQTPFTGLRLPLPEPPTVRFLPDTGLVSELKDRFFLFA
ncbi:MAG: ribonuclease H-like domain-containing protein [Desulfobacteraceae bacterium]|nr:ribonuclease H-like domain-containing protein [Desulfobacteraceae bacterium]